MFYYLIDLHYSQTSIHKCDRAVWVLLPYRFTLFSNPGAEYVQLCRFYYLIDLHYSQTAMTRMCCQDGFYYLIDLHYSQTALYHVPYSVMFYYLIDLHYSQTPVV